MSKLVKFGLATLNEENGGSQFEFLAASLAERRICSNIVPSSGPAAAGDRGMDAKTHETDVKERPLNFRFWKSHEKQVAGKKIIFAFSIDKSWESKIRRDVKKIKKNIDDAQKVCFITNQVIQVNVREDKQKELSEEFGIEVEIFDGTWMENCLSDDDYDIAVRYLDLPPNDDPKIKEIYETIYSFLDDGMTLSEVNRLKELSGKTSLRTNYDGNIALRAKELLEASQICAPYIDHIEQAQRFLELALSDKEDIEDTWLLAEIYYEYFKVLQKRKMFNSIAIMMQEYADFIIGASLIERFKTIFTWAMYLAPHMEVIDIDLFAFAKAALKRIDSFDASDRASHIKAEYDESKIWAATFIDLPARKINHVKLWRVQIQKYKQVPLYPVHKLSKVVAQLAMLYEGDEQYDKLFKYLQRVLAQRNQRLDAAQMTKDRAMYLYEAGNLEDAVHYLNEVKIEWYDAETLRGSVLTCGILAHIYRELGLYYAAVGELLTMIHLASIDKDTLAEHNDLFTYGVIDIYYTYIGAGSYFTALCWGNLAMLVIGEYDPELKLAKNKEFADEFGNHTMLMLMKIRPFSEPIHQKLFELFKKSGVPEMELYEELSATDEEFEKIVKEYDTKTEESARYIRKSIKSGDLPSFADAHEPINEITDTYTIDWQYNDLSFSIKARRDYVEKMLVEYAAAIVQVYLVEILRSDVNWIDGVDIEIDIIEDSGDLSIKELPGSAEVKLKIEIGDEVIGGLTDKPFDKVPKFELGLLNELLKLCTIDSTNDVMSLLKQLDKNGFFKNFAAKLPFPSPYSDFFKPRDYEEFLNV